MPLPAGTRLGPDEITSAIGAGGIGDVYRARDTPLKRDVALRVLPAALARDGDRLSRFRREAELLATLNHPNIAGIYGLEETNNSFEAGDFVELRVAQVIASWEPRACPPFSRTLVLR
jgi:serine/threonine protein kinase